MSGSESWLGEFELGDKWSFCLTAARMAADQESVDDETSAPELQPGVRDVLCRQHEGRRPHLQTDLTYLLNAIRGIEDGQVTRARRNPPGENAFAGASPANATTAP